MIVFVYDTECLKDEADDPVKAVLYFHPSWVSDTQKVALCGQLMGTSYFLKDCFFKPRILALQNGKFILKEFGRFILAVGTDRNISDYLLQYRADLLASLVRLFHRDVQTIYDQFPLSGQYKNLSEKLYHIFETYLPILQHKGNIFQNIPKLRMPITGSNIFLDAMQTLQCCQGTKGVLGGAILYHNKVVATQLSDQITKQLVLTDPLHVRTTAEQLNAVNFHIPNGVQMIAIYIDAEQYQQLVEDSQRAQNLPAELAQSSTSGLNFSVPKRKMKRDQSFIFTNIPEEGAAATSAATEDKGLTVEKEDLDKDNACGTQAQEHTSALPPLPSRPKSQKRPNHLPLRSKNMTTREVPESGIASINFDENDSFPEFIGRTSVCSTPMPENRVFKLDGIISICSNPEDKNKAKVASDAETDNNRRRKSIKSDFEKFFQNFITNPYKLERRNSFSDLQDALKKISNKLSFKKTFVNTTKTDENRNGSYTASATPPDFIEHDDNDSERSDKFVHRKKSSHTITDPTYPVFNANGKPISRSLFQEFLDRYYNLWEADSKKKEKVAELMAEFKEFDDELKKLNDNLSKNTKPETSEIVFRPDKNLNIEKAKTPLDKKALSLPLKPLSDATPSEGMNAPFGVSRKQPGGIPLTPLMAKLSVLASTEERSTASGFCSWDATPGAVDIQTPLETAKMFRRRNSNATMKCEEGAEAQASQTGNSAAGSSDGLQRVDLYICGQQNMTLLLLLEQGTSSKQPVVQSMFDICVAKFPQMENSLNEALSINVGGGKSDGEYSFMHIDSKWDTLHRSGAWNPVELNTLECMHRDFELSDGFMTELIVRSNDSAFYGHRYGRRTFFYKEAAHQTTGVPPPTDPMGVIPMRAKKRLERDHSYILL